MTAHRRTIEQFAGWLVSCVIVAALTAWWMPMTQVYLGWGAATVYTLLAAINRDRGAA